MVSMNMMGGVNAVQALIETMNDESYKLDHSQNYPDLLMFSDPDYWNSLTPQQQAGYIKYQMMNETYQVDPNFLNNFTFPGN